MRKFTPILVFVFLLSGPALSQKARKPKELKPGFNMFSIEQDIQMGKEYAAQIEQQNPPINDPQLNAFANMMLKRLTQSRHAGQFPYTIKVIYDDSINAFALPGGPMYLHTGLIKAAENEAQVAGVLAHEISHVALRHGTNQASKQQLFSLGGALGAIAGGGITGQLAQLGIGLGANSVLMKFSRGAETDADLNGTRMMADVGYQPLEMARFFEKLEAQSGKTSGVAEFFSSHPNPGNRVKRVQEEIGFLEKKNYDLGDQARFDKIRAHVGSLKAPARARPQPGQPGTGGGSSGRLSLPSQPPSQNFKQFRGNGFEIGYPDNWVAGTSGQGGSAIIAPRESVDAQSGAIAVGTLMGSYQPQRARDLSSATEEFVNVLLQNNQGMRVAERAQRIDVNGREAYMVMLDGQSPLGGAERDVVIALAGNKVLQYFVFVAPQSEFGKYESLFQNMLRSVRF